MSSVRRLVSLPGLVLAAAGFVVAFSVWQTMVLARDNRELRGALHAPSPAATNTDARASKSDPAELAKASAELEEARRKLRAAEDQAEKLAAELSVTPADELRSLGRSDVLAAKGVSLIKGMDELFKGRDSSSGKRLNVDAKNMAEWLVNSEAIGDLENDPKSIADVHAHALRETLGLDEDITRRVRDQLAAEFEQLRGQGLDRSSRPADGQEDWYAKRDRTLLEAAARIEGLIPAPARKPNITAQIMNLGTGFRTRTQPAPNGDPHIQLYYQVPGQEPIGF